MVLIFLYRQRITKIGHLREGNFLHDTTLALVFDPHPVAIPHNLTLKLNIFRHNLEMQAPERSEGTSCIE